jgi:hypothetical protein
MIALFLVSLMHGILTFLSKKYVNLPFITGASCECRNEFLKRVGFCALRVGGGGLRKDQGIWNSVTTVPILTDMILTTDRILLAFIVECRAVWINWYRLFNLIACRYIHDGTRWRSRYRHCAAGSNPDGVFWFLHWLIPPPVVWPWGWLNFQELSGLYRDYLSYRYNNNNNNNNNNNVFNCKWAVDRWQWL